MCLWRSFRFINFGIYNSNSWEWLFSKFFNFTMLKFIFIVIFIFFLFFKKNIYWMVQNLIFLATGLFIIKIRSNYYFCDISYYFGIDIISYGLILLRFWICGLILIASEGIVRFNNYINLFLFIIVFLLLILIFTFRSIRIFIFYLFFESRLIPTLFLILGWGYQPERLQAGDRKSVV